MITITNTRDMRSLIEMASGPFSYVKQHYMGCSGQRTWIPALGCVAVNSNYALSLTATPSFTDVSTISEYGLTQKLSNSIRVF